MGPVDRVVIVLSGGPDSATLAYWAKSKGYDPFPITFDYGHIASKETRRAELIAEKLGAEIKVINISSLKEIFQESTPLVDRSKTMLSKFDNTLIVPFRNAIFLSIAVAYAISIGAKRVMYGAHKSDAPFYPDCRKEFVDAFQQAVKLGTETGVTVENPFHNYSKSEIIRLGVSLGVPYELTWSCYLDGEVHCGACESCINRRNAFKDAGVHDPTTYKI